MPAVSAATGLIALFGHPVGHSVSPQIHAAAFEVTGVDAVYLAFDVAREDLASAVSGLRTFGFVGANVTVPHKRAVGEFVDRRTREAETVGAINTLFWNETQLVGDNTDARGLSDVLVNELRLSAGDKALLLGAGGAARAAAVALGRAGATVEVVGRRPDAAIEVSALARRCGARIGEVDMPRFVINATPLGQHGEALPDRFMRLREGQVAVDLVYGSGETPFLAAARAAGAVARDGLGMLVMQAAHSFERWAGMPAPRADMALAAKRALGR